MDSSSTQSLLQSSRSILEQSCPPSLREILGAYKYAKGQDGDCQLLVAVLNAKTAEDQRLAAVAKLLTTMLQFEHNEQAPSTPSSSSSSSSSRSLPPLHLPSNVSPSPRSYSPPQYDYLPATRPEGDLPISYDRKSRPNPHSRRHSRASHQPRSSAIDSSRAPVPSSPYSSRGSDSSMGSPRVREAIAINALLSSAGEDHQKHLRRPNSSSHR